MRFLRALPLILVWSCSEKEAPPADLAAHREMIRETIKGYHEAGDRGDVDGMKAFLHPEVTMFKGQEDFARGLDACTVELEERVRTFKGESRNTLLGREAITITGEVALATYVASVGTQRAPITAVFRKSQGKWLIMHLHESWPRPEAPKQDDK
jgi:ketosteroid isomerase-like protein